MRNIYLFLIAILFSCSLQTDKTQSTDGLNKFSDPLEKSIANWQDQRSTDSLIAVLRMSEPQYQVSAATALASVQDKKALSALVKYLSHENEEVRKAVAYALGQSYDTSAFVPLLKRSEVEFSPVVNAELLESAGKTVSFSTLKDFIAITPQDINSTAGYMWGLYRAGLRGIHNDTTTSIAVNILDTASLHEAKLAAAHYLSRIRFEDLPSNAFEVLNKEFADPEVRMAVAGTFSKAPALVVSNALPKFLKDEDYRVRINAIRTIPNNKLNNYSGYIDSLLLDKNMNTAIEMATKVASNAHIFTLDQIKNWLQKDLNWRTRALLLKAMLAKEPSNAYALEQVKKSFSSSQNPYEKAALLAALENSYQVNEYMITEMFKAKHPAISTSGISTLYAMRKSERFPDALDNAFADVFKQAIETGDPALIDIASAALRDPALNYKESIKDYDFLREAKKKLKLPKENETLQSLEKTLAYFEDREAEEVVNEYNNPIDWEVIETLEGEQNATIITNKGDIKIRLHTNEAPGSVANFVKLAKSGYFNNKNFHRVVPNFVIQGGGNRGDGYGSEDYSIRSEFANLRYTTGTIGMASAGKDTEGTQWFITHSPTPHLDGRYTIFAQVMGGFGVLHQLGQGDVIKQVKIN